MPETSPTPPSFNVKRLENFRKQFHETPEFGEYVIRCEDCPAANTCKRIKNFRKTCEPGSKTKTNYEHSEKCYAGIILLLDRLVEILEHRGL